MVTTQQPWLGQGWQGMSDEILWLQVPNEGRWLMTADKGFADLRQYRREVTRA